MHASPPLGLSKSNGPIYNYTSNCDKCTITTETLFVSVRTCNTLIGAVSHMDTGPRELSIRSADAINDIHGPKNMMRKGEFYEQIYPAHSLQFNRNLNQHKHQRRFWDKAFQTRGEYFRCAISLVANASVSNPGIHTTGRKTLQVFYEYYHQRCRAGNAR